jgi:heme/copper-type cytochrome/quinol oxidase subunit 2
MGDIQREGLYYAGYTSNRNQVLVDNYLVLTINTNLRVLLTSNDVIHSFAIQSCRY